MKVSLRFLQAIALGAVVCAGCHKKPEAASKNGAALQARSNPDGGGAEKVGAAEAVEKAAEPTGAVPSTAETKALATANPDYESWFRKYHLDLNDPKMLDADPDGDGYTNREEFLAGTDPLDPNSHPDSHSTILKDIRLKEYSEVQAPFILKSVDGNSAKIQRLDQSPSRIEEVHSGQTLKNTQLKVAEIKTNRGVDKEGNPVDSSRVTLRHAVTKETTMLVKDLKTRSPASSAVLTSADGSTSRTVRQGETFQWPGKTSAYKVIDIGPDLVLLQQVDTGKTWTVKKW